MNTIRKSLDISGKLLIDCAMNDEFGQTVNPKELINPFWKSNSDHSIKTECGQKDFFETSNELFVCYFMNNGIRIIIRWQLRAIAHCGEGS